jgi:hypothetical protein
MCDVVILRGPRKGRECARNCITGQSYCARHAGKAACRMSELPSCLLDIVCDTIATRFPSKEAYETLRSCRAVSKELSESAHRAMTQKMMPLLPAWMRSSYVCETPQMLEFFFGKRCQKCGCVCRTIKAHRPFMVRMCKTCFSEEAIPVWQACHEHGVMPDQYMLHPTARIKNHLYVLKRSLEYSFGCSLKFVRSLSKLERLSSDGRAVRSKIAAMSGFECKRPLDATLRLVVSSTFSDPPPGCSAEDLIDKVLDEVWLMDVRAMINMAVSALCHSDFGGIDTVIRLGGLASAQSKMREGAFSQGTIVDRSTDPVAVASSLIARCKRTLIASVT